MTLALNQACNWGLAQRFSPSSGLDRLTDSPASLLSTRQPFKFNLFPSEIPEFLAAMQSVSLSVAPCFSDSALPVWSEFPVRRSALPRMGYSRRTGKRLENPARRRFRGNVVEA